MTADKKWDEAIAARRERDDAPARCYADSCVLAARHEPTSHQSANGYKWASVHPQASGGNELKR